MSFQVPLSSSPMAPSTPGSKKSRENPFGTVNPFASNPSTTPAGPPPSSSGSFTPAEPPPSSLFGSSQTGSGKSLFKGKNRASPPAKSTMDSGKLARFLDQNSNFNFRNGNGSISNNTFNFLDSSPLSRHHLEQDLNEREEEDDDAEGEEDEEDEGSTEEYSEEEDRQDFNTGLIGRSMDKTLPKAAPFPFGSSSNAEPEQSPAKGPRSPSILSTVNTTPRGTKRSRGGAALSQGSPRIKSATGKREGVGSDYPGIALNMSKRLEAAPLEEPDDLIIGTEDSISTLYAATSDADENPDALALALSAACEKLCNLWNSCRRRDAGKASWREEVVMGIGPDDSVPSVHKAIFLSTLLLSLYHPAAAKGGQALAVSRRDRSTQTSLVSHSPTTPLNPTAYPKVLLDWLDENHNPYRDIYSEVASHKPNCTAHESYWSMIYKLATRGEFANLIVMLKKADFGHARTAREDGHKETGYRGAQLENVDMVIGWAIRVLQACPALTDDDWHVPGNSWIIFRKHVEKAMENLINFAEGRDKDLDPEEPASEAPSFGLKPPPNDLSRSSRRAESRVPWAILQNLKTLYGILMGGSLEILSYSENWLEGSIALTAWWSGEDDEEVAVGSQAMNRRYLKQSKSRGPRLVDTDTCLAYRRRLALAFERVTQDPEESDDDPPMLPDTSKPLEVALSSILGGDATGAIGILRGMSLPVADAVVEIGTLGDWLHVSPREAVLEGFDEDDMDLLSFERSVLPAEEPTATRKAIMMEYAEELFNRSELTGRRGIAVEGWELSIAVLARLGMRHGTLSRKEIRKILKRLPLDSDEQIDKIVNICREYDMPEEGRKIVERYADFVLDNSDDYGTALIYYARAHSSKKIKDVLDLLVSYSLVQSVAYPAPASLDTNLHSLVFAPKESLEHLALLDEEGAAILHEALTGYATLRKYYDIRDEEMDLVKGQKPTRDPTSRKRAAAGALLAIVNSAADNIRGGLYDQSHGSIVHVDGLLALLGEALVFLTQTPPILNLSQLLALLRVVEDLSTITPRIYSQCDEFLCSTLAAYSKPATALASPRQMLKKQMSSITTGSSFSLVGSSLLDEQLVDAMEVDGHGAGGGSSSKALTLSAEDEVKRGWDWRRGMDEGAKGEDVLRLLRVGLAKDMAACWMRGEGV